MSQIARVASLSCPRAISAGVRSVSRLPSVSAQLCALAALPHLRPRTAFRRHNHPTHTQRRPLTSPATIATTYAFDHLRNSVLQADDYYINGLPQPKFRPSEPRALSQILSASRSVDPFSLVEGDMRSIADGIRAICMSDHPILERVAKYMLESKGKRIRPVIVLLMSRALAAASSSGAEPGVTPAQQRLSEITELIHTASLLHDDVVDEADTRRGVKSVNALIGSKMAVLGGDFLLARASVALAQLRNPDVIELLSQVIEHLVKGEMMQIRPSAARDTTASLLGTPAAATGAEASTQPLQPPRAVTPSAGPATDVDSDPFIEQYITKSYYKTASLFANSCKAAAILGGLGPLEQEVAFEYGKHFGLVFQIVDDLLDFVGTRSALGKPTLNDLRQGIATMPVLYAAQAFPELRKLIARKFSEEGDVELALSFVERANGLERTRARAVFYAESAVAALQQLPPSRAQSALINLIAMALERDR